MQGPYYRCVMAALVLMVMVSVTLYLVFRRRGWL